jgi:hypothetical protein
VLSPLPTPSTRLLPVRAGVGVGVGVGVGAGVAVAVAVAVAVGHKIQGCVQSDTDLFVLVDTDCAILTPDQQLQVTSGWGAGHGDMTSGWSAGHGDMTSG